MTKYSESGVDFDSVGNFRRSIISELTFKGGKYRRATDIGHYSGLVSFMGNYIAIHTDNVGTKTIMALEHKYMDELGYDLVGMNVNDIVCMGAEPMAMVDYIAGSVLDEDSGRMLGRSINEACREAGIPMVGGETASVPDLVKGIDISGTVVGYLERGKVITGRFVKEGDRIIGLESSGFHSNGFSLIRRTYEARPDLLNKNFHGEKLWKKLLKGTRIYSKEVYKLTQELDIHGIAHITGGGIRNLLRLNKKGYRLTYPKIPDLFTKIINDGGISYQEAFEVFNMGIGMMVIASKKDEDQVIQELSKFNPQELGIVVSGRGVAVSNYGLKYANYY